MQRGWQFTKMVDELDYELALELIQPRLRQGLKPTNCNSSSLTARALCLLLITPPPNPLKITVDIPLPTPDKLTPQRRQ